ncbi:MAG: EamA family transporter [Beijerinckiaceae bacterium]
MLGGILALLSAASFALNNAAARRGVLSGSVLQAMAISVPFGVPFFFLGVLAFGSLDELASFSGREIAWLAAAGILHFVLGRYANYRGAKAIGAVLMGPIQDLNILVSLILAVIFLGEKITPLMAIGIALVVFGPTLVFEGKAKREARPKRASAFKPAYAEGFFFAALSGLAYGASPILVRIGLESAHGVGTGVAAGLISYIAATLVVGSFMLVPGGFRHVRAMGRQEALWFTLAGLFVGIAQMTRYMALAVAPVAVVAPIMRLSSIFRIYFSWLLNRQHEHFSSSVILATVVSLAGAVILGLSADNVAAWLGLSPEAASFLGRKWP